MPSIQSICTSLPPWLQVAISAIYVLVWDYGWGKTETGSFLSSLVSRFKKKQDGPPT